MPQASRLGDIGSGHACHFPPTPAIEGSPDVFINGKPAFRVNDALASHGCPAHAPAHSRAAAVGSATVNINGQPAVRIGDAISCGGVMISGSSDVIIGDDSWGSGSDEWKPAFRIALTQVPGDMRYSYSNESYKLYRNGALVQEGRSDAEGMIVYETDEVSGIFEVEATGVRWTLQVAARQIGETDMGARQRLETQGYDYLGFAGTSDATGQKLVGLGAFQGDNTLSPNQKTDEIAQGLLKAVAP